MPPLPGVPFLAHWAPHPPPAPAPPPLLLQPHPQADDFQIPFPLLLPSPKLWTPEPPAGWSPPPLPLPHTSASVQMVSKLGWFRSRLLSFTVLQKPCMLSGNSTLSFEFGSLLWAGDVWRDIPLVLGTPQPAPPSQVGTAGTLCSLCFVFLYPVSSIGHWRCSGLSCKLGFVLSGFAQPCVSVLTRVSRPG